LELVRVAEVYREAWLTGENVTSAVAQAFYISKSAAAKRIGLARKAGLLDDVGRRRR
jgi:hypothetical protein